MNKSDTPSEFNREDAVLALMSVAAGATDAISFLTLGDVFSSAMTGNTIILGVALGSGNHTVAIHALFAFAGYILGVALLSALLARGNDTLTPRRVLAPLAIETALLAVFVGLWLHGIGHNTSVAGHVMLFVGATAMGIQGAVGLRMRVPGVSTVVFTLNLTNIVAGVSGVLSRARQRPVSHQVWRQFTMYAVYLASAVVAGAASTFMLTPAVCAPLLAIVVALALSASAGQQ